MNARRRGESPGGDLRVRAGRPIDAPQRFAHTGACRAGRPRNRTSRLGALEEGAALIAEIEVGAVIDGTVARITPYGAFLQLEDGRLGLVHISEVDRNYVKDVHEHLREGDVVQAKVVAIKEDGKIDLSIKALQDPAPPRARRGSDPEFEQMLKKFMRQSEERLVDYKRAVEHKRK
jgi:S1 RNA binding domain protein